MWITKIIIIKQCYNCQSYKHFIKTCQHEIKCEHCVEKHFFEKCHMTSNNKKMRCVLCDDEHKTWFNICEYQKKKTA